MAGTYPTTPQIRSLRIRSIQPVFVSISHALNTQRRSRSAQRYGFVLDYPAGLTWADIAPLYSFLLAQDGRAETFDFELPQHYQIGAGGGTPVVDGGSQTGTAINIRGGPLTTTGFVKAGDFVHFAGQDKIYISTADADTDGAGDATLSIIPALIESPADAAAVSFHTSGSPLTWKCTRASDDLALDVDHCLKYGFTVELVEVI